jgi:membrane associated rhomboid family serine protease
MRWVEDFDNGEGQGPMWIKGYPVYGTTLLIIIHCATMIIFTLLTAMGKGHFVNTFTFSSFQVLQGKVWQLFTYPFVQMPSIWFAVEMLMLYWFGKDVEKFVGRKAYFSLYLALILIPSLFLTLMGKLGGFYSLSSSNHIHFSIFIAFATIYPNAVLLFRILAKYVVYIYLAIATLQYFAYHDWIFLTLLWLSCGIAFCGMKLVGVQGGFDWWNEWRTKAKWKKMERKRQVQAAKETETNESIDPILEKISKQGMNSLTDAEKRVLERARSALLKKDKEK